MASIEGTSEHIHMAGVGGKMESHASFFGDVLTAGGVVGIPGLLIWWILFGGGIYELALGYTPQPVDTSGWQ